MAHISWIYSIDLSGEDEARQAIERQPYFMLKCSKIIGASYVNEISKKDIPDIIADGYMYFMEDEQKYFVLDKHCAYLLGVFNLEKKRVFQQEYDSISEKSKIWNEIYNKIKKIEGCITYQNIVQSFLSSDSDEYKKSFDLLCHFKEQFNTLKKEINNLEEEIKKMILEYIYKELRILIAESNGINIQGTMKDYLNFFMNK
jgi:dGTP triphosphohydrolase